MSDFFRIFSESAKGKNQKNEKHRPTLFRAFGIVPGDMGLTDLLRSSAGHRFAVMAAGTAIGVLIRGIAFLLRGGKKIFHPA